MSFSNILFYLKDCLSEKLISKETFSQIYYLSKSIDINRYNSFGFESVLNNGKNEVDFSIEILQKDFGDFIKKNNFITNDNELINLLLKSNDSEECESIWIEFEFLRNDHYQQKIYFKFINGLQNIDFLIEILKQKNNFFPDKTIDHLKKITDFVKNENKTIKYIGFNNSSAIRFTIMPFNIKELILFLERINIHTDKINSNLFFKLAQLSDYIAVNLDIGEKIEPVYSIEYRVNDIFKDYDKKWNNFLKLLNKNNLCDPDKCNGLMEFTGCDREIFSEHLVDYNTYRLINHIKATIHDERIIWKVYYGFIHCKIVRETDD